MARRSRQRSRQRYQRGGAGEGEGMPNAPPSTETGGDQNYTVQESGAMPTGPAIPPAVMSGGGPADYPKGPYAKSQYYTVSGGSRKRGKKNGSSKRRNKSQRGGTGVLATAAVPFGLLALQRYFKGSRKTKKGVANMGRSFKRTFRRRY